MLKNINWLAVAVAVIALEVIGYCYYGIIMRDAWTAAYTASLGRAPDDSNMAVMQSIGMVNTLIIVLGLNWALPRLGLSGTGMIRTAAIIWLCFNFTTMAIDYIYMGMSTTLVGINMGFQLISYLVAGAVLGMWPAKKA
jgi:Protein of unknown function (DUF1761)